MAALQELAPLVPDHLPQAISGIQSVSRLFPTLRQMVCFDTAFLYLIEARKMTPQAVDTLINRQSGLLGVSGTSDDVQDLLDRKPADAHAGEALELFCYRAKKYLGAYVAALGGLDILVFTGGIGTHARAIRQRICAGLECLGILLDPARNRENAPVISGASSTTDGQVKVRVIKTDEELMITTHAVKLLSQQR